MADKTMHIPIESWRPYEHHLPLINAFEHWEDLGTQYENPDTGVKYPEFKHTGSKIMAIEWHRQSGKDEIAQVLLFRAIMHTPGGSFGYMFPTTANIKNSILNKPKRMAALLPKGFIVGRNKVENIFYFMNGAVLMCAGSNNYDTSFMGSYFDGCVFSEFQNTDPAAWPFVEDMLRVKEGWALFNGTPRGEDHFTGLVDKATTEYQNAVKGIDNGFDTFNKWGNINYYGSTVSAEQSGLIDQPYLRGRYHRYRDMYGDDIADSMIRQEVFCSREAGDAFAYYRAEMEDATKNRTFDLFNEYGYPHKDYPVHTAWDLSEATGGDDMAVVAFQVIPNHDEGRDDLFILDYYYNRYQNVNDIVEDWVVPNGYDTGYAIMPWEVSHLRTWQRHPVEWLRQEFGLRVIPLKNAGSKTVTPGIQMCRRILRKCYFDKRCDEKIPTGTDKLTLMNALRRYKGEHDPETDLVRPKPSRNNHLSDAMRYLAVGIREQYTNEQDPDHKKILMKGDVMTTFKDKDGDICYYDNLIEKIKKR